MKVRVLRIIEITGEYEDVAHQVQMSVHGTMTVSGRITSKPMAIRAATIGEFPEILEQDDLSVPAAPKETTTLNEELTKRRTLRPVIDLSAHVVKQPRFVCGVPFCHIDIEHTHNDTATAAQCDQSLES